jgi:hypothetical protein
VILGRFADFVILILVTSRSYSLRNRSGSLAKLTAILCASSFVSIFAADRRPGSSS